LDNKLGKSAHFIKLSETSVGSSAQTLVVMGTNACETEKLKRLSGSVCHARLEFRREDPGCEQHVDDVHVVLITLNELCRRLTNRSESNEKSGGT